MLSSNLNSHLKPGGWIEQSEISVVPQSDDGTIPPGHIFELWGSISLEAGEKFGKTLRIHELAKGLIEDTGFTNVVEKVYILPIGPWCRDPHMKQLGLWNQLHWQEGIEGWSMAMLTRTLGVRLPDIPPKGGRNTKYCIVDLHRSSSILG